MLSEEVCFSLLFPASFVFWRCPVKCSFCVCVHVHIGVPALSSVWVPCAGSSGVAGLSAAVRGLICKEGGGGQRAAGLLGGAGARQSRGGAASFGGAVAAWCPACPASPSRLGNPDVGSGQCVFGDAVGCQLAAEGVVSSQHAALCGLHLLAVLAPLRLFLKNTCARVFSVKVPGKLMG